MAARGPAWLCEAVIDTIGGLERCCRTDATLDQIVTKSAETGVAEAIGGVAAAPLSTAAVAAAPPTPTAHQVERTRSSISLGRKAWC
mmetsp:Transcript_103724/g.163795  ORF Transcript_103724/g.163795 Transcript_103724/m.163795 type:complete len:87 (+) Transcript_103724:157-417(+)